MSTEDRAAASGLDADADAVVDEDEDEPGGAGCLLSNKRRIDGGRRRRRRGRPKLGRRLGRRREKWGECRRRRQPRPAQPSTAPAGRSGRFACQRRAGVYLTGYTYTKGTEPWNPRDDMCGRETTGRRVGPET